MADKSGKNQVESSDVNRAELPEAERRLGLSMLTRVVLAVVVLVSLIISISCVMTFNQLESQKAELQAQVDACNQEIDELQYLINAPMNDEYIARIARERLKLHFPDEYIYHSNVND